MGRAYDEAFEFGPKIQPNGNFTCRRSMSHEFIIQEADFQVDFKSNHAHQQNAAVILYKNALTITMI